MFFRISGPSVDSLPRAGVVTTAHGEVATPTYMPVGTYGAVKLLDVGELRQAGASILVANSYHLHSSAGAELIRELGGLARFSGWNGPTLTDSGGYQVSYMWRSGTHSLESGERKHDAASPIQKITDDGAKVKSVTTGETYWLTPERAMEIQAAIGADLVMAFDQPTFDTDPPAEARRSLERTHDWIGRSWRRFRELQDEGTAPDYQQFVPIVQGGRHRELRRQSAELMLGLGTPAVAIAGESIGIDPDVSVETVGMVRDLIPPGKLLYAMGLGGGPEGFLKAVRCGVDVFDNTSPTRLGRCGLAYLSPAAGGTVANHFRIPLKKGRFRDDPEPIDPACGCKTCRHHTRAYLRHLLKIADPLGMRLVSYHNVWFMLELGRRIREAITGSSFDRLYASWIGS